MGIRRVLDRNGFVSAFNTETGDYIRSGLLDMKGCDTGIDAFMAEFPQLLDIGIMGHCIHGLSGKCGDAGTECYQSGGSINQPNMPLSDYEGIINQCEGRVLQVALGGRGDPDQHESFEDILRITREYDIVPNITTSGSGLTWEKVKWIKKYCGAAAVSYYKTEYMYSAIKMLNEEGVRTNLHFVLGNNSIKEAIDILSEGEIPEGIDRIVFLLHKPVGMGSRERVLDRKNPLVQKFFTLLSRSDIVERTGFDSCCVPAVIEYCPEIAKESFDACESGRFSAYIDSELFMNPCSFDVTNKTSVSLKEYSIEEAWNSRAFDDFRKRHMQACSGCSKRSLCMGGCPVCPDINLCQGYSKQDQ